MQIVYTDGRVEELDDVFFLNPKETIGDLYAVSMPFGNFSRTFLLRAREHEIISVLLESKWGDSIKVDAGDLATATNEFLLSKGYTREQIAELKKDADNFNSAISAYGDDESLHSYFENEFNYAFDGDLNVWYRSDLIMRNCVNRVAIVDAIELLNKEHERLVKAQQDIMAKPTLNVEHDPGFLDSLEAWKDALRMIFLMIKEDGLSAAEAVDFRLGVLREEGELIRTAVERERCNGSIPVIVMRGQRFSKITRELEFLEAIKKLLD